MDVNSLHDMLLLGYGIALAGVALYLLVWCLKIIGKYHPSPTFMTILRYVCFVMLLAPVVVKYQFSEQAILYLALAILMVAGFIWIKQKLGV